MLASDSKFYTIDGNNVTLTCDVTMDSDNSVTLAFEFNGKRIVSDENYILSYENFKQHDHHNRLKAQLKLTIINVNRKRDEGGYSCIATDHINTKNSTMEFLKFVENPVLTLKPNNTDIKLITGAREANFLINADRNFTENPAEATIYIFNPRNEQILIDDESINPEKYNLKINGTEIQLSLNNPDIRDYGSYTIVVSIAGRNFTTSIKLTVSEGPTVHYIEGAYVLANEPVNMICRLNAYPVANVSWGERPKILIIYNLLLFEKNYSIHSM